MSEELTNETLLDFAHFVATKFSSSVKGWTYTRDLGDLVHIRYKRDTTGRNRFDRRLRRALNIKSLFGHDDISIMLGHKPTGLRIRNRYLGARAHFLVAMRKNSNLPDGMVNGNIVHWEEDGEYIALFGPTVGVKVIEFLRAEPDNPYAQAIMAEMRRMADKSWPPKAGEDGL